MSETSMSASSLPIEGSRFSRLAGRCLRWATFTLVISGVSLGLFFAGAGAIFGPVNDLTTAATLLLIVPAALAVRQLARRRVGGWFSVLTFLAVVGISVAAGGLLLLVARVIGLTDSFVTGGIGMLPFLAWLAALAFVTIRRGVLTPRVGWLSVTTLAIAVAATAASPILPMSVLVFALGLPMFAVLGAWLWVFGSDLLEA